MTAKLKRDIMSAYRAFTSARSTLFAQLLVVALLSAFALVANSTR